MSEIINISKEIPKPTDEKIHCWFGPLQEYPMRVANFHNEHPNARIRERLTNIFMGEIQVPDPMNIGHTKPQLTPMIVFAYIYKEKK